LELASEENRHAAFLKADTSWDWVQCSGTEASFPQIRGPGYFSVQFCLIYLLLFKKKGEKKEEKGETAQGLFFPHVRHTLLAEPCWDFLVIRYN
jgi:hypothetical protein